jgi:hypothetical protein
MKKSIKNFEKNTLSRNEMKKIAGSWGCSSGSCDLVIIGKDGQSMTLHGSCGYGIDVYGGFRCHCDVGLGANVKLSSNGGLSRCWS